MARRVLTIMLPLAAVVLVGLGWAGFAPIEVASHEQAFDIPKGTYARRRAGDLVEILPDTIRLTLGLRDVLLIRNHDDVPQIFGPTIMMPGQSFRLPFERAASYQFVCSAHASGQLTIDVEPEPTTPWARIHWRAREWWESRSR
jgi:hypothetical protein